MNLNKKKMIITHSGKFHADDVFAVASFKILFGDQNIDLKRTRDEELIKSGDIVIDVGGIYDESKDRFDHHQTEGAGKRTNNIPYSSFGLVWKKYGKQICSEDEDVANYIDRILVQPIDAIDNGVEIFEPLNGVIPYTISHVINALNPTWDDSADFDVCFMSATELAKSILQKEINRAKSKFKGERLALEIYKNTEDKRIIIMDKDYPVIELMVSLPEPLFFIYPKNSKWHVSSVRINNFDFKIRKAFPDSWAGKRDEDLVQVSGVSGAVFCHRNLFLCVANSKEGAIELAKVALA